MMKVLLVPISRLTTDISSIYEYFLFVVFASYHGRTVREIKENRLQIVRKPYVPVFAVSTLPAQLHPQAM